MQLWVCKHKIYLSGNTVIYTISGGNGIEDPPVPIPNTEVKLNCAEGTWLDTAREIRSLPDFYPWQQGLRSANLQRIPQNLHKAR